jgi:hypothetical protein
MIDSFLAASISGLSELFIIFIITLITLGPLIALVWTLWTIFFKQRRENIRLRLEVGKLADELEKIRKKENSLS